ncbi:MAG: YfiT family bacillithiol transferase [Bacteroidota bacterium]
MSDLNSLKYPAGRFSWPKQISQSDITEWIQEIEAFPALLKEEVQGLTESELNWRYRPDGWNIRQVVHHVADSHFNSLVRFKLALTEDTPTIKPYEEAKWAELADSQGPIESSLAILNGLHERWAILLKSLTEKDLKATYFHPEQNATRALDETIALYAWHCRHHLAHVKQAKDSEGKYN